ncbi:hypothetical protein [Pseudomonas asiatica]|uniref:hypothetical protein n=1 Tax=Pseudomonas asiatica TaxID=2219225 RepID=UPI0023650D40|nr:hypothetical protein [Pseudomonas asiatica]MDD1984025.1 hypothetical protein [Pseudomonas asiatica]
MNQYYTLNGAVKAEPSHESDHPAFENERLIIALHNTQEKLERISIELSEKARTIDILAAKLERYQAKFPDYWNASSITYIYEEENGDRKVIWTVTDTELGNNHYSFIQFETAIHDGVTGIKFLQGLHYFKSHPNASTLNCLPVKGAYSAETNKSISAIGTSDWKAVKDLARKLQSALSNDEFPEIPKNYSTELANGLTTLKSVLEKWPKVPRYDTVELSGHIESDQYQALDLTIDNLEVESIKIPQLSYRLSSVNEPGKPFGQFPRLEFDETTADIFEKWFIETSDHRGSRLELRFADPDQMDVTTWRKLSQRDQLLIAANISALPQILKYLKNHAGNSLDWSAWEKISTKLKNILANTIKKY